MIISCCDFPLFDVFVWVVCWLLFCWLFVGLRVLEFILALDVLWLVYCLWFIVCCVFVLRAC